MSFHEINLLMQTLWTSLALLSLWLRAKGNYLPHWISMLVVVAAALISFSSVLLLSPLGSFSVQGYFNTPLRVAVFAVHGFSSVAALASGMLLLAFWRPHSNSFIPKTNKIAKVGPFLWVVAYVAGILAFLAFQTALLG